MAFVSTQRKRDLRDLKNGAVRGGRRFNARSAPVGVDGAWRGKVENRSSSTPLRNRITGIDGPLTMCEL